MDDKTLRTLLVCLTVITLMFRACDQVDERRMECAKSTAHTADECRRLFNLNESSTR